MDERIVGQCLVAIDRISHMVRMLSTTQANIMTLLRMVSHNDMDSQNADTVYKCFDDDIDCILSGWKKVHDSIVHLHGSVGEYVDKGGVSNE